MVNKEVKNPSGKRRGLAISLILSSIFLITIICFSMLYASNNTDTLRTVFIEESYYSLARDLPVSQDLRHLSRDGAISVLSLTNDQLLYNIDTQISDSIESAGIEINKEIQKAASQKEQVKAEEDKSEDTQSSSIPTEAAPPASSSAESSLINMINYIRSANGLQTLIPNGILNAVARSRSQDMINRGYFSHYTPEGKSIGVILQENGVMYACCAENLSQASPPSWGSPETVINLWMGSSSHRANLLNPHFGQMGIGIVDSGGRRVVTLVLINR